MFDLLLLPISFSVVLAFYEYLEWRKSKCSKNSSYDASVNIVNLTSTNNNYDSLNNVLDELDSDEAQVILGKPLYVNMRGYM